MKRAISILILVCANLILLAHSVAAHHHDGTAMELVACSNGGQDEDSEHHTLDICFLNNAYPASTVNIQKDGGSVDDTYSLYSLIAIIGGFSNSITLEDAKIDHRFYLFSNYSFLVAHSSGLRGPPVC